MTDAFVPHPRRGRPPKNPVFRASVDYDGEPDAPLIAELPDMRVIIGEPVGETGDRTQWNGMDTAPLDGRYIRLTAEGVLPIIAQWRLTRRYFKARWVPTGKWQDELGRSVKFEPEAWRPV